MQILGQRYRKILLGRVASSERLAIDINNWFLSEIQNCFLVLLKYKFRIQIRSEIQNDCKLCEASDTLIQGKYLQTKNGKKHVFFWSFQDSTGMDPGLGGQQASRHTPHLETMSADLDKGLPFTIPLQRKVFKRNLKKEKKSIRQGLGSCRKSVRRCHQKSDASQDALKLVPDSSF